MCHVAHMNHMMQLQLCCMWPRPRNGHIKEMRNKQVEGKLPSAGCEVCAGCLYFARIKGKLPYAGFEVFAGCLYFARIYNNHLFIQMVITLWPESVYMSFCVMGMEVKGMWGWCVEGNVMGDVRGL